MKITKYSQSTFIVENSTGSRVLIDPGKYNYENGFSSRDFGKIDLLIVTHKHEDHHDILAEKEIIAAHKPLIFTCNEIGNREEPKSLGYQIKEVGDTISESGFKITFIAADHFAKCEQIINFGLFIETDGFSFYHTSDSRFMEPCYFDHELVRNADVLAVPISNRGVVMGLDDSIVFTSQIEPKIVIPMHYDSPKDKGRINGMDFLHRFSELSSKIANLPKTSVKILNFGESFTM